MIDCLLKTKVNFTKLITVKWFAVYLRNYLVNLQDDFSADMMGVDEVVGLAGIT